MSELIGAICLVCGLFALIALMPAFDGWRDGDWEPQDPEDEHRRPG
jgi:hypothetical protein